MSRKLFVNLPVRDLDATVAFFTRLGFSFDPEYTDANATCMRVGETAFVMLLVEPFFAGFLDRPIAEARERAQVLLAVDAADREAVDAMVAEAVAAGGRTFRPPQDHGFMYQHGFEDLDGHLWEVFHMSAPPPG
ncbi:glyoxalase/bleomycin resistance/extradiol dioxygenase family protein [Luteimonas sp. Y-2-2-4F]|nr:VOC family protein [Luteimonas sp. Y-2-2-4F]MCD9032142.1 glyoxalase/bleomycin resistance/extradiol dioxygenase family protein [Luteimonas sp. Y-2-2-4F]